MPTHSHPILYNANAPRGSIWGNNTYNGGNFGAGHTGVSGFADTDFKG